MKLTVISIRDTVANQYSAPTYHQSKGTALRSFAQEVNRADENNTLYKYPGDYEIYCLGTFDDEIGEFQQLSRPEMLGLARDYVIK